MLICNEINENRLLTSQVPKKEWAAIISGKIVGS